MLSFSFSFSIEVLLTLIINSVSTIYKQMFFFINHMKLFVPYKASNSNTFILIQTW